MSDGPPSEGTATDEQLRRIERGVRRRIDRRREVARALTGAGVAVALLGGGLALVVPIVRGGSFAASAGGSSAGSAAPAETVRCHASSARGSAATPVRVPAGSAPDAVAAACAASVVDLQSGAGRMPSSASGDAADAPEAASAPTATFTPSSSSPSQTPAAPAVVCRATDGVLHVFPADARPLTLCSRNRMRST